jgi:excinuclease ABC subunit C
MRGGKVRDSREVLVQGGMDVPEEKILGDFISSFYLDKTDIPPKILLPFAAGGQEGLSRTLSSKAGRKVLIAGPAAGKNRQLIDLANRNAESAIEKRRAEPSPEIELSNILGLKRTASRIEGFDVSNTGGEESVGSVVVFRDGKPDKNEYRKFKIKTVQGPNDVGSLEEIVLRRYRRAREEGRPLPDLVLIDGGVGQLGAARKALGKLGLNGLAVITLAKREEMIFSAAHPEGIKLDRTSAALKLIQQIRDEAHRFAVSFHRRRREKKSFASELDGIPGLGPKRKTLLLAKYKHVESIRTVPPGELALLVGRKAAEALLRALSSKYGGTQ